MRLVTTHCACGQLVLVQLETHCPACNAPVPVDAGAHVSTAPQDATAWLDTMIAANGSPRS